MRHENGYINCFLELKYQFYKIVCYMFIRQMG